MFPFSTHSSFTKSVNGINTTTSSFFSLASWLYTYTANQLISIHTLNLILVHQNLDIILFRVPCRIATKMA